MHYRNLGLAVANEGAAPAGHGGGRGAYVDTIAILSGMTELREVVPELTASLSELEATAANWDGTEPISVQNSDDAATAPADTDVSLTLRGLVARLGFRQGSSLPQSRDGDCVGTGFRRIRSRWCG
jgi:hypothetical protein